jgi:hypothetical protein
MTKTLSPNVLTVILVSAFVLFVARATFRAQTLQQPLNRRLPAAENLHGVLSHQTLHSPIRGGSLRLRFSPDGKFLLLQGISGFLVFSTSPLKPVFYLDSDYLHEARFAPDSHSLTIVSFALQTGRWRLPEVAGVFKGEIPAPGGCLAGELSPAGNTFACYRPDLSFHLYDVAVGSELLADKPPHELFGPVLAPISFFYDNIAARPIGYMATKSSEMYANRGLAFETIDFSPDGEVVLLATVDGSYSWNLSSKHRSSLPSIFKKPRDGSLRFLDNDRIVSFSRSDSPQILSLKTGKSLAKIPVDNAFLSPASDSRYLMASSGSKTGRLFDLESSKLVEVPENVALDVRDNILAIVTPCAELALFHLGDSTPLASSPIPLASTPSKLFVAASPALDFLSFGFGQQAALFRVSDGEHVAEIENTGETAVPSSASAYFVSFAKGKGVRDVIHVDPSTAVITPEWKSEGLLARASPFTLYEYAFDSGSQVSRAPVFLSDPAFAFELIAREWASGRLLWKKQFSSVHPVPFPDPQGKRLVLGWDAKGKGGESAAKRCPQAWPIFRNAKLNLKDTFFEVLDGSTGSTVGGALVQAGAGPLSFDAVFSAGPMLVTSKDEGRAVLYSLQDGQPKAHLNGSLPAASAEAQLLALVENGDRLVLYDLLTGGKLDQQQFPEGIAYTHFSADGQRLLVLTRRQRVYILDVSETHKANATAP